MPNLSNPHNNQPNTYIVEKRFSKDELARLMVQERMATNGIGGLMPEQPDPTNFQRVLDIACGPGGWLIETARTYPMISQLIGVDVNPQMIACAQQQAELQQVSNRVQFLTMDALQKLDFPDEHFDLINQRLAVSYLRTWDWPILLNEMKRLTRVGGVIRLTEPDPLPDSTGPVFNNLSELMLEALHQSGHLFRPNSRSVSDELPNMLSRYGLLNVQTRDYIVEYRSGTHDGDLAFEITRLSMRNTLPFLRKWIRIPNDFEEISQQALAEMQEPGFVTTWHIRTVWGNVPTRTPAFSQL